MPDIYECEKCGKRTLSVPSVCSAVKKLQYISSDNNLIFISSSFEIYKIPVDSSLATHLQLPDASEHQAPEPEQEPQNQLPHLP